MFALRAVPLCGLLRCGARRLVRGVWVEARGAASHLAWCAALAWARGRWRAAPVALARRVVARDAPGSNDASRCSCRAGRPMARRGDARVLGRGHRRAGVWLNSDRRWSSRTFALWPRSSSLAHRAGQRTSLVASRARLVGRSSWFARWADQRPPSVARRRSSSRRRLLARGRAVLDAGFRSGATCIKKSSSSDAAAARTRGPHARPRPVPRCTAPAWCAGCRGRPRSSS